MLFRKCAHSTVTDTKHNEQMSPKTSEHVCQLPDDNLIAAVPIKTDNRHEYALFVYLGLGEEYQICYSSERRFLRIHTYY